MAEGPHPEGQWASKAHPFDPEEVLEFNARFSEYEYLYTDMPLDAPGTTGPTNSSA